MSRIKKLLVAVLCIALTLSAALLVVAACDRTKQDETGYKLTLTCNPQQGGSVTATAPAEGELYDADEEITITVTPNADYTVKTFTVNNEAKQLADNKYTFAITADTTVAVTFEQKQQGGEDETCAWEEYIGEYKNEPESQAQYNDPTIHLSIGKDTITLTIEGTEHTFTGDQIQYFSETVRFTLGVYDVHLKNETGLIMFEVSNTDDLSEADCVLLIPDDGQGGDEEPCPWSDIIGIWENKQDNVLYHVEITATNVIVKFDGEEQNVTKVHWVEDESMISITIGETEYYLMAGYTENDIGFASSDWHSFNVFLYRVTEGGGDVGGDDDNLFSAEQIGTYTGNNLGSDESIEKITITIFENSIVINGEIVTEIEYDADYEEWSFESNGKTYWLGFSGGLIMLYAEDYSESYSLHSVCPWLDNIGKFETDPADDAEYGEPHVILTITEDSVTVQIADQSFTVQAADITFGCEDYGEEMGLVFSLTFEQDGTTYYAFIVNKDYINLMNDADEDYIDAYLYREGTHEVCEWAELIGTWTGKGTSGSGFSTTPVDVMVEITETEITVTIGQDDPQTAEQISVSEDNGGYILTFTLGQQTYTFDAYQGEATFTNEDSTLVANLSLENAEPIEWSDAWYGEYQGEKNGTNYYIEITSDTVNVTIGDSGEQSAEIIDFSDYDGFTIKLGETTYTIKKVLDPEKPAEETIKQIRLSDEEFELQVTLSRQEETLGIPQGYIGNWTGVFEDISFDIDLVVSDTSIQINGNDATNIKVNSDSVTFSQGAFEYTLTLTSTGIHIKREAEYMKTQEADLTKGGGGGDEDQGDPIPEKFYGTYEGSDSIGAYVLEISADGITFTTTYNSEPDTPTTIDGIKGSFVDGEIHFTIPDADYEVVITNASQDDTIDKIHVKCGDMGLDTDLTRKTEGEETSNPLVGTWSGTFSDAPAGQIGKPVTIEFTADGHITITLTSVLVYNGTYEYNEQTGDITLEISGPWDITNSTLTYKNDTLTLRLELEDDYYDPYIFGSKDFTKAA